MLEVTQLLNGRVKILTKWSDFEVHALKPLLCCFLITESLSMEVQVDDDDDFFFKDKKIVQCRQMTFHKHF